MEYYFETDDKLDRKRYAEFLKSMLENCEKYRREDCDGAYVIAIDSPWGTGKTRFAKMLRNFLEGREPTLIKSKVDQSCTSKPSDSRKFNVIYYNSWETDYWGDALEPLIHNVLNSELFELIRADKDCDEVTSKLWRATKGVLKAVGLGFARNIIGDAAAEVIKGTIDELNTDDPDPLAAYSESIRMYNQFKEALTQTIEQTGRKLVIVVDELDRCRPTFAIQTLELAKHLFSVKGLVFVFALDIKQLSNSVKTVYGIGMDAAGYLGRFFDYIGRMPNTNIAVFIRNIIAQNALADYIQTTNRFVYGTIPSLNSFVDFVIDVTNHCELSFRDINTLFVSFQMMCDTFLKYYKYLDAYKLYFLLLTIKYKYPTLYNEIMSETRRADFKSKVVNRLFSPNNDILVKQIESLDSELRICDQSSIAFLHGASGEAEMKMYGVSEIADALKISDNVIIRRFYLPNHVRDSLLKELVKRDAAVSLNLILFINDIAKWETIKHLTPLQYYYQQLEMFNFALPADMVPAIAK